MDKPPNHTAEQEKESKKARKKN